MYLIVPPTQKSYFILLLNMGKNVEKLNGIFAFCIWHSGENKLYLFRDRSGVKPLFYTIENNTLIFASEIKALFCHPYVNPEININSFREIFGIGPARTEGFGVFKNIYEIKYGHYGEFNINGFSEKAYWKLSTFKTNHTYEVNCTKCKSVNYISC